MDIFSILLLAISLSVDAFTVSMSSGMLLNNFSFINFFKFSFFFGFFQFLMTTFGYFFGTNFTDILSGYSKPLGFLLLFFLGLNMFYNSYISSYEEECITYDDNEILNTKNILILSIATSIDALIIGIFLAMINSNIIYSASIISFTSFVIAYIGLYLGFRFSNRINFNSERLCGLILFLLSFKILYF